MQVLVVVDGRKMRPTGVLSNPRAPAVCARVFDSGGPPRPSPVPFAPRAFRNCAATSFLGTPPRAAFSFSRLAEPDRHYCRERGLARGRFSIDGVYVGGRPRTGRGASYLALPRARVKETAAALPSLAGTTYSSHGSTKDRPYGPSCIARHCGYSR